MTTTEQLAAEYESQRQAQLAVRATFLSSFIRIWPVLKWNDLDGTFPSWSSLALKLIRVFRQDSADLALKRYADVRLMAAPKALHVPVPTITTGYGPGVDIDWAPHDQAALVSLEITGPGEVKRQARLGRTEQQAMDRGLVSSVGSASRQVLVGGRTATLTAVDADTQAVGWARLTDGDPCPFCLVLASRGPAYKSERSAGFQAHDHDACIPVAVFDKSAPWPGNAREYRKLYDEVAKGDPDPINAIRRHLAAQKRESQEEAEVA